MKQPEHWKMYRDFVDQVDDLYTLVLATWMADQVTSKYWPSQRRASRVLPMSRNTIRSRWGQARKMVVDLFQKHGIDMDITRPEWAKKRRRGVVQQVNRGGSPE